jgi:uncharacterized phage protein gp47/JayE
MSQSPDQVAAAIIATLNQTAPALSLATGTPERQLVDACATQIAAAMISQYMTGGMMDINTKTGLELDQFVGIFGFGRLQGAAAGGVIVMTLTNVSTTPTVISLASQFYTTAGIAGATQTLYYASTQAVTLPAGQFTCTIPVLCTAVGTAGNVPPDSITSQSAALGASTVTNLAPMTGGVNVETDAALRQRFMDTLLRNIAGTSDWYINLALQNKSVSRVVVYGPVSLYKTQIAVPESTLTLPVSNDVKYAWPGMTSVFQNLGTSDETFYSDIDDYTLSSGASPVFTNVPTGALEVAQIVDVEFQYTTKASRNDPVNGITNKIDTFVDGNAPFTVTETTVVSSQTLSATSTSMYFTGNFERVGETSPPSASNRFMRLGSVPIINFPTSITVAATVYTQGTHYHLLAGTTPLRGSQLEVAGIEWEAGIPNGTQLTLNYTYNQVPELLDAVTNTSKQICTDVLNHVADYQYITTNLTVEYARAYAISTVNTAIVARLQIFYQGMGFGSPVILSQLMAAVQQVLGVNEVHVTTSAEVASGDYHYGIWVMDDSATVASSSNLPKTTDFVLNDNQLAVYQNVNTTQAPNIGGGGA